MHTTAVWLSPISINNHTYIQFSCNIGLRRKIFESPVPNTRTMIPTKYPPQQNLPLCTDRDASYLTVQTSFSLIANRLMPLASLQPLELGSSPVLSLELQEKTPPSSSSTQKNPSNVKYIPLETDYRISLF